MQGYLLLEGGAEFGGQMAVPDLRAIELAGGPATLITIIPTAAAPDNNHQRAGRERGKGRRPKSQSSARCGEREPCFHERGFAWAHIAILSQRSLPKRGRLSVRDRRGDAPRI